MGVSIVDEFTAPRAKAAPATSLPSKAALALGAVRRTMASAAVSPWKWMAITCLLLASSGGLRSLRSWQFEGNSTAFEKCPFPLTELPKNLGGWRMIEGAESTLDRDTAQVAGSTDDISRAYMSEKSDERVDVLIVYGLAISVFSHNAETCYPAGGWASVGKTTDLELTLPGSGKTAQYRRCYFTKKTAVDHPLIEVVYSFRHDGEWLPEASSHWKKFRTIPGMFKVQVQRRVAEKVDESGSSVELLGEFMEELDRRLAPVPAAPALSLAPMPSSGGISHEGSSASQGKPDRTVTGRAEPAKAD